MRFHHQPVLLQEVLEILQPSEGKVYLDGTLGGGGHSEALLERGAVVIGCDRDMDALQATGERLAKYGSVFEKKHGTFDSLLEACVVPLDGVLLDLGVSSHQLDTPERGFSFRWDGPLDMRMDTSCGSTAADLLNHAEEGQIVRWLAEYGEEPQARRVAREIIRSRSREPFVSCSQLVVAVEKAIGHARQRSHHPATRTFQAIRIAVNDELGSLRRGLPAAVRALKPGGRLAVISFHSLEDRMVKTFMRDAAREFEDTPAWPNSVPNPHRSARLMGRKAVTASEGELESNPRSRSAKLRAVEKLEIQ